MFFFFWTISYKWIAKLACYTYYMQSHPTIRCTQRENFNKILVKSFSAFFNRFRAFQRPIYVI